MPAYQYGQPRREMISQSDAATIEKGRMPRATFHNRWTRKTAFDAGYLIPFLVDEILPGDYVKYNVTAFVRMATPVFPVFDMLRVDTHIFYVPNRLVWDHWVNLMGEQPSGSTDSIAYTVPQVLLLAGGEAVGSLFDHMGIPVLGQIAAGTQISVSALPFRMYNLIYNKWFRDENQPTNALVESKADAADTRTWYINSALGPAVRAKSHDYFTSALPWPQKFTAPTIPLGTTAPVTGIGKGNNVFLNTNVPVFEANGTNPTYAWTTPAIDNAAANSQFYVKGLAATGFPQIFADLSAASTITINTLRQAWLIQALLERDARGGSRYIESIKHQFGVTSPDARLQRPEYIGGGQSPLNITPIAQTATGGAGLGTLGGAGTSAGTHQASYAATEHGYVIGLISIRSELSYQQGLHKHWSRTTRYEFYVPALAELGEQAILQKEIFADGNPAQDNLVFGYQARWEEYRTRYSDVTGIMRSTAAATLDKWHLAQQFAPAPLLNMAFLVDTPPMTRVLAAAGAATGQQFLADILYNRTITRVMPTYGTPANLSRF